jgi:hypothetical protein
MNYSVQINLNLIFYQTKIPTLFLCHEYNKQRFTWFICNIYGSPCNVLYLTPVIKLNYYLTTLIKRIQPFHLLN